MSPPPSTLTMNSSQPFVGFSLWLPHADQGDVAIAPTFCRTFFACNLLRVDMRGRKS